MKTKSPGTLRPLVAVALTGALLLPAEARSQERPGPGSPVVVGSKVRLLAPTVVKGRVEGVVVVSDDASLVVSDDGRSPLRVPREAITRLEVSTGTRNRALKGLVLGAAIGAVAVGLSYTNGSCDGAVSACLSGGAAAAVGVATGALVGVGIGALRRTDRWSAVPVERVRLSLGPTRGGGVGASVSVGF